MPIVNDLKATRIAQGKGVREVARKIGLHEHTIHASEKGHSLPSIGAVEAWAAVLGMEVVLVPKDADKSAQPATPTQAK